VTTNVWANEVTHWFSFEKHLASLKVLVSARVTEDKFTAIKKIDIFKIFIFVTVGNLQKIKQIGLTMSVFMSVFLANYCVYCLCNKFLILSSRPIKPVVAV
jgi:hypothetical protein